MNADSEKSRKASACSDVKNGPCSPPKHCHEKVEMLITEPE